jgi:hypothetical protein
MKKMYKPDQFAAPPNRCTDTRGRKTQHKVCSQSSRRVRISWQPGRFSGSAQQSIKIKMQCNLINEYTFRGATNFKKHDSPNICMRCKEGKRRPILMTFSESK